MGIKIIAAVSDNNVIGVEGRIPWRISEDLKQFKELTTPHPIIMGRVTYESIPPKYRPLPGRLNVVLTRDSSFNAGWIYIVRSLQEAFDSLHEQKPFMAGIDYSTIFIGGGQQIYEAAISYVDSLEITHVHQQVQGLEMRFFPKISSSEWKEQKREDKEGYSFVTYVRT